MSALGLCLVISHQVISRVPNLAAWGWLWALCGLARFGGGLFVASRRRPHPFKLIQLDSLRAMSWHGSVTQRSLWSPAHLIPPPCQPALPCPAQQPELRYTATLRHCNSQRPIGPFPHLRHLAAKNSPTHTDGSGRRRNQEVKSPQRFHHPNDQSERRQGVPVALTASNNLPELPGTDLECAVCYINKPEAVAQAREARHGRPGSSEAQTGSTLPHRRLRFDDKQEMAT